MAAYIDTIQAKFGISKLTVNQERALTELKNGRDVFMCVKTGGGKSLVYQAFPMCGDFDDKRVLVISPLVSIMKEQTHFLRTIGFTASYIGESKETDIEIEEGCTQFVYSSPESVLESERWRTHVTKSTDIGLLVIDEAHTVIHWSEQTGGEEPFREWFGRLGELRSLLSCPVLVMTATVSKSSRKKLKKKLALVDCCEIVDSPERENVKLFKMKVNTTSPLSDTFAWLYEELETKAALSTRYIIFANSITRCSQIMTSFHLNLRQEYRPHVNMFHSCTPEDVKEKIRKDMDDINGSIRVLIATSAAGMGVNYKGVNNVVHFGPPKDMDSFVQQIGRAGRDGSQSYHLLIYSGGHLRELRPKEKCTEMREYTINDTKCRREVILESYSATKKESTIPHLCCDICANACSCGEADCELNKLPYVPDMKELEDSEPEDDSDMWNSSISEDSSN